MKFLPVVLSLISIVGHAEVMKNQKILHQLVFDIRDPATGPKEFRKSLSKIGEYLGFEVMQDLSATEKSVLTLTGATASHLICDENPVLITILRAGIPLLNGVQEVFPDSEVGFLGMARNEETLQPTTDYIGIPNVQGKTVLLIDTMLATGGSLIDAAKLIQTMGPKKIIIVCAIASQAGIEKISATFPDIEIYPAAIDPTLNDRGYIVPGLGDAGDRSFGKKA